MDTQTDQKTLAGRVVSNPPAWRFRRAVLAFGFFFSLALTGPSPVQAGDILRGGATAAKSRRNAEARAGTGAEAAAAAKQKAHDRLARTSQAITAVRNMQNGARSAIVVPDGLVPGGLKVATGANARWSGANAPSQSGKNVVIKQTESQAVLHWETFNIGRGTKLRFDQTAGKTDSGKWIAFNKIFDPSGQPSRILGSLQADGQVYVINQNGVIFGAGSQVNARTLVASSLPINDNLLQQGLLNNRDAQFLFSALEVPGGSDGTSSFVPPPPPAGGKYGDVVVHPGAIISSSVSADGNGGRIMLVGANVRNEGILSSPSGQTILAAGLQVGIQAHAQDDPSLRGLDVWIGAVGDYAGTAANTGLVEARTGSILMAGKEIHQQGVLDSSTSVSLNGRIDLLASYGAVGNPNFDNPGSTGAGGPPFLSQFTGIVRLEENSVTRILPDYLSEKRIPGQSLPENSQIHIEGLAVYFGRDSILLAPGGDVRIRAGIWPYKDTDGNRTVFAASGDIEASLPSFLDGPKQKFLLSGGQVYIDAGALLDVSGSVDVFVPLAQHLLNVQLRGSELADSPLLRNSNLRGLALLVDIRRSGTYYGREWVGTPLGDLTGLAGIIERAVAELTTAGGTISIEAGSSIVVQAGATLDVSGGYYRHEGGMIQTSRLMRGRHLVDIDKATPDVLYDGVYEGKSAATSEKWGVRKTYVHSLGPLGGSHQKEYLAGAAGGTISLTAPSLILAGDLVGRTIKGPRQEDSPPKPGALELSFRGEKSITVSSSDIRFLPYSPVPPKIRFVSGNPDVAVPEFRLVAGGPVSLAPGFTGQFLLGTALFDEDGAGFGSLKIDNREGDVLVPRGTKINLPPGGSLAVRAANVFIQDDIKAPGGALALTAYNFSPFLYQELSATGALATMPAPAPVPGRGIITVGDGVRLDVAGMMVDDRPTSPVVHAGARVLEGGSVTLEAYSVRLGEGSVIDASGGVWAKSTGGFAYGAGGDIAVLAGKDPELNTTIGGELVMDGLVEAYSVTRGGSLTVQANRIQIGGTSADDGIQIFQPEFFRRGGFTSYSLIGIGARGAEGENLPAVRLVTGTAIEPVSENWILNPFGPGGTFSVSPYLKPAGLRPAASVSLSGIGADDKFTTDIVEAIGLVVLEEGSRIATDPGGSVRIKGDVVGILGAIEAPGGLIAISGAGEFPLPQDFESQATFALPTVYIGSQARLSAAGKVVYLPDPFGRRSGIIYPGGTISVAGNLVAEAGAVLDVSGASAILDFHPTRLGETLLPLVPNNAGLNSLPWGRRGVAVRVDSDGGLIELHGSQMMYSDATLLGRAGGPAALGGTLSLSSGRFYAAGAARTGADINLIVEQSGSALEFGAVRGLGSILAILSGRTDPGALFAAGSSNPGIGYFAVNRFADGGFDSLDLGFKFHPDASPIPYGGNVEFRGAVTINARGFVRLAGGGVVQANAPVSVNAPYVAIGQEFRAPLNPNDPFFPFQKSDPASPGAEHFFPPTFGPGALSIHAELIDMGTLSLQGIGRALFAADGGDIRGNGTLSLAGDLILRAAQIYPTTLAAFNIFAYDHAGGLGSVTVIGSGVRAPPLSAGGSLNIFASTITQGGTLLAPFGSITLGWDGTDLNPADVKLDQPLNPVVGATLTVPTADRVTLRSGSITSVSGVDWRTGEELLIPFGLSPDGLSWIDPRGMNVTASGLPSKGISISGNSVVTAPGSLIDLRGGGDLLAYRWVSGNGGSIDLLGTAFSAWGSGARYEAGDLVSYQGQTWSARVAINPADFVHSPTPAQNRYWTLVPESYAVLPGFHSEFAPFNSFNTGPNSGGLAGDPGYVSGSLRLGQQIYLESSPGLAAGFYTLLPRRYAILPGAHLVIPQETEPIGTAVRAEGSSYVSGYTFNHFHRPESVSTLRTRFEVVSPSVLAGRVQYDLYSANAFLSEAAERLDVGGVQPLPMDSASLSFHGNTALRLHGGVLSRSLAGGRGARIDISSFADIFVVGGAGTAPAGAAVVLDAALLSSWGADSLLIGGLRRQTSDGIAVDVRTSSLTLDNRGSALVGPDVVLVSREQLILADGASLRAAGRLMGGADPLLIAGDGALLRVSRDPGASVLRSALAGSTLPLLAIGAGARIAGSGVILDSTYGSDVDPTVRINAHALTMGSGQISILLDGASGALAGSVVDPHLVLDGTLLDQALSSSELTLLSYRSIDFYGDGVFGNNGLRRLSLLGGGLRGFDQGASGVVIAADEVLVSNPNAVAALPAPGGAPGGSLAIQADVMRFGSNAFSVTGYQDVYITAGGGVVAMGDGTFTTAGNLTLAASLITGAKGVNHQFIANGMLHLLAAAGEPAVSGGLGATLSFAGSSVSALADMSLPGGSLSLRATSGDLIVGGRLSVEGAARDFYDITRYADAGNIELAADAGNVALLAGSEISLAAAAGGGNAGTLLVRAPGGVFDSDGVLAGTGGAGGRAGTFLIDAGSIAAFSDLNAKLDAGSFFEERNFRVRSGDITVDGVTTVRKLGLSTDAGSITVTGVIDASGETGGRIVLIARDDLVIGPAAVLTVAADRFSNAGKGGAIHLEAGAAVNGVANTAALLDLQAGSVIDLSVADFVAGGYTSPGSSAFYGQFEGTLHLRAPRLGHDVRIGAIESTIVGGSSVQAEAYRIYTPAGGVMNTALRNTINSDAVAFIDAGEALMRTRLLSGAPNAAALDSLLVISPGAEIINLTGDLTLGLANPTGSTSAQALAAADWDLSSFRYGSRDAPGILTLRAQGDLVFNNTLSDGFAPVAATADNGHSAMWLAALMTVNDSLPVNTQSWSFRLTAGADLGAADFRAVLAPGVLNALQPGKGSVLVGEFYPAIPNPASTGAAAGVGSLGQTADTIRISTTAADRGTRFEVIRTGTGDIDISAGKDVQLRNQFATIYSAGVRLPVSTQVFAPGDFSVPLVDQTVNRHPGQGNLGEIQQIYTPQWSMAGGDIRIAAGADIGRFTLRNGLVIADSSRQMPVNWLYRRGFVDPATGLFAGNAGVDSPPFQSVTDPSASTAWWIDYSNFFQGIGALGGGDIALHAGGDIINTDAVIPTNARMAGRDPVSGLNLAPDAENLHELGGGDLSVRAGRNIDGGVYYVERGAGRLFAGGEITTNAARTPSLGILGSTSQPASVVQSQTPAVFDSLTWLPTTLFVGKSTFDVGARGDILLGPVANPFMLPQGINNKFWYKTVFNTFSEDAGAAVASFGGSVTHRLAVTLPGASSARPILDAWLNSQNLFTGVTSAGNASHFQPWLRLSEISLSSYSTLMTIGAPNLRSTAFAGDLNIVGPLTLFPSPTGQLELAASGGIIGLHPTGRSRVQGRDVTVWTSATINLSDADPASVPGITAPLAYQAFVGRALIPARESRIDFLSTVSASFRETGSFSGAAGAIEVKRALHAPGLLHAGDPDPMRLYAGGGDITGLTVFSPKAAQVLAGNDILDVAFYLQNARTSDISIVSAGRDVVPFNENAPIRALADNLEGGQLIGDRSRRTSDGGSTFAMAGDIQISGPGVLEVLAGRHVDLGVGANFSDGTGVGVTSVGNARNPFLPFGGADIVILAGVKGASGGAALGLTGSTLNFDGLLTDAPAVGGTRDWTPEHAALAALEKFFMTLQRAGEEYEETGNYDSGFAAISSLFGRSAASGDIFTRARDIRTVSGGSVSLLAPGGGLTMSSDIFGSPLTPPGVVTEYGGAVSIFTDGDVSIGQARIFTLRGGDMTIWSSRGDIAAGTAPKTVVTAPPTRVLIDATSADIATDLGGLATGGGIGVLASVEGVEEGNVILIAPEGTVDAGDAGIRATGNITVAATALLNADNVSAGGTTTGAPSAPMVAAPNVSGLSSAASSTGATTAAASQVANQARPSPTPEDETPSEISVEVLGYGGEEEER